MSKLPELTATHDEEWANRIRELSGDHLADSVGDNQLQRAEAIANCVSGLFKYRILDLGCGYGNLMRDLAKSGH